ncbi:MAG: hypothetical protein HYX69_20090 [Planctomycetia bacterium]|nr:hypothetical protein [Planctomycetia bacterium]
MRQWLQQSMGVDYFATVVAANVEGCDGVRALSNLPRVRHVTIRALPEGVGCLSEMGVHGALKSLFVDAPLDNDALRFIGKQHGLERLHLQGKAIDDNGIMHLRHLSKLTELFIQDSRVTGTAFASPGMFPSLTGLTIQPCLVDDIGMRHIAGIGSLKAIALVSDKISDQGMSEIAELANLQLLCIGGRNVTDAGIAVVQSLPRLRTLLIDGPAASDASMVHVARLQNVERLGLERGPLTDCGLEALKNLPKLTRLILHDTSVTPAGVQEFRKHVPRCIVLDE